MRRLGTHIPWLSPVARRARAAWLVRRAQRNLRRHAADACLRIVIGASGISDQGWIPTEMDHLNLLRPTDWTNCFEPNSIDAILAEHVWEHLTHEEGLAAARQCFAFLKPGGYLRAAVPDAFHPDPDYQERVRVGAVGHKVLFTHSTFQEMFVEAGFAVTVLEYFDRHGAFHAIGWNPEQGTIRRSSRFDRRNAGGALVYTSIIIDAHKPS